MIHIVGPGGSGKSTVGSALATRLGIAFVDLDAQFAAGAGDISAYLTAHGYDAYAAQNVQVYLETRESLKAKAVIALSAGFMTYRDDVNSAYPVLRRDLGNSVSTVVLLPSFDHDACVVETVRRQLRRPFSRSAEREEAIIRTRLGVYCKLPAKKVATIWPVATVVDNLVNYLLPYTCLQSAGADAIMSRHG
jgi:shikimate kinase